MATAGKGARSLLGWTFRTDGWVHQYGKLPPLLRDSQVPRSILSYAEHDGFWEATDLLGQAGAYG